MGCLLTARISAEAVHGSGLGYCEEEAIVLAATHSCDVEFVHDDRTFLVRIEDLHKQVVEQQRSVAALTGHGE